MAEPAAFDYRGNPDLRAAIERALREVVDPETALSIVDMGLVVSVDVAEDHVHVRLVMTSAACPVAGAIVDDVEQELDRVLPASLQIRVEVCSEPAWTPQRMSEAARRFMRW